MGLVPRGSLALTGGGLRGAFGWCRAPTRIALDASTPIGPTLEALGETARPRGAGGGGVYYDGGSGSNEVLTLAEVAERLGLDHRSRADRSTIRRLRRLEARTGRHILVTTGEGRGTRHLVRARELDAALEGDVRLDTMAEKIAAAVSRIEARVERVSVGLDALTRRVARLEGHV